MTVALGPEAPGSPAEHAAGDPGPSPAGGWATRPSVPTQAVPVSEGYGVGVGSDWVLAQAGPGPGRSEGAAAPRSGRPRARLLPESSELGAEPAASPAQALLGELRDLLDGLQAAGQDILGGFAGPELSQWLLLALVVAVTIGVARREIRNAEIRAREAEGGGTLVPWLV